jgi:hypothetical protein
VDGDIHRSGEIGIQRLEITPPFTAPEMLASLTSTEMAPTPASDVFSLAATLNGGVNDDIDARVVSRASAWTGISTVAEKSAYRGTKTSRAD